MSTSRSDSFGTDNVSSSSDYMSVENADSEEAREAEEIEEEHAQWAETAAQVRSSGDVTEVESEPEEDEEAKLAEAIERYSSMGSVVAGAWRPKPIDVTIGGKVYVAYISPNSLRQLPGGGRWRWSRTMQRSPETPQPSSCAIPRMTGRTFSCLGSRGRCWMMEVSCTDSPPAKLSARVAAKAH